MSNRSEIVRLVREDAGFSQALLARRAGTSQPALSAIESGARPVSDELYRRLLDAAAARPSVVLAAKRDQLLSLAADYGLSNVRVFGSVVRGDDGPGSDVDVLAHLDVDHRERPLRVFGFPQDAQALLGFPVDLVLDDSQGKAMPKILAEAVPL